ncbi:MAG: redoxin domain-containing protein [Campylobacterota bacterium]|nr:redoxin domain-containing protein [Campylobacterota bacterium]
MKNKFKHYFKEIISFIVILTILANIVSYYKSQDLNKNKLPIDNITLNNKPIMIHFWATWCPICKIEAPNIQTISKHYEVLTIAVKSQNIKDYLQQNNLTFKVIDDIDGSYADKFNISVYPTTLIYDKDKNLIFSEVGYTSTFGLWIRLWWSNL